ncbi:hypothetical protein HanIR_Chr15g0761671 [Helianthus annuus]|nr:hypothetical protein HanIR_Chr15g0761671 [Helianthus annuus]
MLLVACLTIQDPCFSIFLRIGWILLIVLSLKGFGANLSFILPAHCKKSFLPSLTTSWLHHRHPFPPFQTHKHIKTSLNRPILKCYLESWSITWSYTSKSKERPHLYHLCIFPS